MRKQQIKTGYSIKIIFILGFLAFSALYVNQAIAADKVFHWKMSTYTSSSSRTLGNLNRFWVNEVEKRSKGRIKTKIYWANELCGAKEMMMTVKTGLADVVNHCPAYTPSETPIMNITFLPFISTQYMDWNVLAYNMLARKSKFWKDEFDKFNCVYGGPWENTQYNMMGNKPIRSTKDLDGIRTRCMSDLGKVLANFGTVPMSVPVGEMYTALNTGVVDTITHSFLIFYIFKIHEISKYMTLGMDMGAPTGFTLINKDSWNELPEDLKGVINSVIDDTPAFIWNMWNDPKLNEEAWKAIKGKGIEVNHFPSEERAKLKALAKPVWDKWAERYGNVEEGNAALAEYLKIQKQVMSKYPNGIPGVQH